MVELDDVSKRLLRIELAKMNFYEYCKLRLPNIYTPDREFLQDLCTRMQEFVENSPKKFMVVNMPPRFCKSLTGQIFTEWQFGKNPSNRVITASYNERLAGQFAKHVRNSIQTPAGQGKSMQFADVFPGTKVSKKDAAADMWSIEGSPVPSYLATSPGGTATGMGCNIMFVDDLIKNSMEAYSDLAKDSQAEWFFNTMMSRLEDDWKVIVIMTRWATDDLAGRILESFDCVHVDYKAYEDTDEGRVFLCPSILDEKSFDEKSKKMNNDIIMANYQQEPVDIRGRLYYEFNTYKPNELSVGSGEYVYAVTDTADKGTDSLCSIVYVERDGIAYVLDVVFSDSQMEVTEQLVADMFDKWSVKVAFTESNNGGRLFARNVRRIMKNKSCVFLDDVQTSNKIARIIESSGWVQQYVYFPEGWKNYWSKMYGEIMGYNVKGKNAHDDAVDSLAYVYMMCTRQSVITQTGYEGEQVYGSVQQVYDDEPTVYW